MRAALQRRIGNCHALFKRAVQPARVMQVSARYVPVPVMAKAIYAEPDSCYYIQHVNRIEGRHVDLATDPPPDLIIEVDLSSPSGRRLEIYKQLGIPEIWRYASGGVQIYQLREGAYVPCDASLAFPMVSTAVINQFLQQAETQDATSFIRAWRRWIRQQVSSEPS